MGAGGDSRVVACARSGRERRMFPVSSREVRSASAPPSAHAPTPPAAATPPSAPAWAPAADAVTAAEVIGDAADEHARVGAAVRQQPPGQRRCGRLAVRPRDDDRARSPQEVIADRLAQRAEADLAIEDFLELGVAAGN